MKHEKEASSASSTSGDKNNQRDDLPSEIEDLSLFSYSQDENHAHRIEEKNEYTFDMS